MSLLQSLWHWWSREINPRGKSCVLLVMRATLMQSTGQRLEFTKQTMIEGNGRGMALRLPVLSPALSKCREECPWKTQAMTEPAMTDWQCILVFCTLVKGNHEKFCYARHDSESMHQMTLECNQLSQDERAASESLCISQPKTRNKQ